MSYEFVFWFLSILVVLGGVQVVLFTNPIYSALSLVMTMLGIAGHFFLLDAQFLGAVQLVVYAGAVMVLFVMVLMLFDLQNEKAAFSAGKGMGLLKIGSAGVLCGLIAGAITMSLEAGMIAPIGESNGSETQLLAKLLITKYVFNFEVMGILLLVVAVGAVALARSKGGTHGQHKSH